MIKKHFQNAVKAAKMYPSADANLDYVLLAAKIKIRFEQIEESLKTFYKYVKTTTTRNQTKSKREYKSQIIGNFRAGNTE